MSWQEKLVLWKNDKKQPMTCVDVDTSYAIDRINAGRMFLKLTRTNVRSKKVLDVAVGCGGILCAFAEAGAECYGLDVNSYFIDISKTRFKEMKLKHKEIKKWKGGGYGIPYPEDFFDFVICTDTLHHAPNRKHFIREICRVLKPGGKIFVSEERRWFPTYVLKSPHDNMPFTVLLPRSLRSWIEKNFLHLPSLDHYMYSFGFEIVNDFRKNGVTLKKIDGMKREAFNKKGFPKVIWPLYNLMFMQFIGVKNQK
jgi:ubiquinone/menaquinone biosynthesis C-methylase UbiE